MFSFVLWLVAVSEFSLAAETQYSSTSCISNGALRLVGGSTAREGTVEICLDSTWGTMCDNFFGTPVAQVVCRQLGYPASGAVAHRAAHFGQGSGPVHIGNALCKGTEQTIMDCQINYENSCVHSEDAGVECTAPCSPEGGVRLTGGDRPGSGTVWVCISGTWSTVCDNFWNIPDARVVCKQLGYDSQGAQAYASAFYGEGYGPILLDYVQCDGNEAVLLDCTYTSHSQCDHSSDAGVACYIDSQQSSLSPETIPSSQSTPTSPHHTVTMKMVTSFILVTSSSSATKALTTPPFMTTTPIKDISIHHSSFFTSTLDIAPTSSSLQPSFSKSDVAPILSSSQEQLSSFTESSLQQQLSSFTKSDIVAPTSSSLQLSTPEAVVTSFESLGQTAGTPTQLFTITQEQSTPTTSNTAFPSSKQMIASFHTIPTAVPLQTSSTQLSSLVIASSSADVSVKEPLNQSVIIGASAAVVIIMVIVTAVLIIIGAYCKLKRQASQYGPYSRLSTHVIPISLDSRSPLDMEFYDHAENSCCAQNEDNHFSVVKQLPHEERLNSLQRSQASDSSLADQSTDSRRYPADSYTDCGTDM